MIAIPWYINNTLGLSSLFGQLFLGITFVSLFWGLYAGALIDRFNRRNIFIANAAVGCAILFSVAGYGYYHGELPLSLVALILGATFFIYNLHYPNLYAFAQEITEPRHYSRITSWIEIQGQATTAVAGAVAAMLLAGTDDGFLNLLGLRIPVGISFEPWALHEIFLMDGITYIIAIAIISTIKYQSVAERVPDLSPVLQRVRTGIRFLVNNPLLFLFGVATHAIFVTILISNFYLVAVYINNHLERGVDVYGAFEMFFALGSLFSGVFIASIFRGTTTVKALILLMHLTAVIYATFTFNEWIPVFYLSGFLLGLSNAGTRILRMTYLFKRVPNTVIGRVGSVFIMFNVCFRLLFIALFAIPFFTEGKNIVYPYGVFMIFLLITAAVLISYYTKLVERRKINNT